MTITGIATNTQALLEEMGEFLTVSPGEPDDDDFQGYPSAVHYYVDGPSDYATVTQNRRTYEYAVDITIISDKATSGVQRRLEANALMDKVIDKFDKSIDLSSPTIPLARACDIMRPAPSAMIPVETEAGKGLMMSIRLFCEADVTFRDS